MSGLGAAWPWALAAVVLLALAVLVALLLLLKRSASASHFADAPDEAPAPPSPAAAAAAAIPPQPAPAPAGEGGAAAVGLRRAFHRARRYFDRAAVGNRQTVPFFLLLGAQGSRPPDLLAGAGLDLPFGPPRLAGLDLGGGRGFWLFGRGAVLDLAGPAVLRADGTSADEHEWRTALGLLQWLRPRRPVDGVVLTLSCAELLAAGGGEAARAELAARAARLCRRLGDAQEKLGFRLPVYVLVTGGEALPGFASFSAALPPRLRGEMLGWSSPYIADAAYRTEWAAEAVSTLGSRLDDLLLEVFAEGSATAGEVLQLPDAVRSLRPGLESALDQLFVASAYAESVLCRGVFLCGTAGAAPPQFLEDLLAAKVFPEAALAAPAARTVLARNRAVRAAQALTAAAALLFAGGLLWARSSLEHQRTVLRPFLGDTRLCLREVRQERGGPDADLVAGAFHLLLEVKDIDFPRVGSVFAPSSLLSPFGRRVHRATTAAFDEVILTAIRLELESKARGLAELGGPVNRAAALRGGQAWGAVGPAGLRAADLAAPAAFAVGGAVGGGSAGGGGQGGAGTAVVGGVLPSPRLPRPLGTLGPLGAAEGADESEVLAVEKMPEFAELKGFVESVRVLEANGRAFNQLGESRDLRALGGVVEYALGQRLPDEFYQEADLYQRSLGDARYKRFDPAPFRAGASRAVEDRVGALYEALFLKSPLVARLEALTRSLQRVAWSRPAAGDTESFAALARRLGDLESVLSGPDLEWAFGRQFDLGPGFAQLLGEMEHCELFDPGTARKVRDSGAADWGHFRTLLAASGSLMTGPILAVRGGKPEMQLSADAVLLKTALATFLGQGFAAPPPPGRTLRLPAPAGMRLQWDAALLGQAAAAAGAYERFRGKGLELFPADLRGAIDEVARERTRVQMMDLLAGAEAYRPVPPAGSALFEAAIRSEVEELAAASQPIGNLLETFGRLQLPDSRSQLGRAMNGEAFRLLRDVDQLLAAEQPYRPRDGGFAWWDGAASPTLPAFGARDAAEVAGYLEATRTRIAALARNDAQPVVAWLAKAEPGDTEVRELAAKWQGILDDLRDYEAKKPGNDVAALEDFVTTGMGKVKVQDCAAAAAGPPRAGRGFFGAALHDLSHRLAGRCYALAVDQAAARYGDVERYFNQRLAGRYPFAAAPPGAGEAEATPEDLRSFFRLFDAGAPVVRALPAAADAAGAAGAGLGEARRFLEAMARVRAFFAPFLDAEKPEPEPAFDVEATFRVLREREEGGDQIIGWALQVGDHTVTDRDKERKLRWKAGDPVTLSLRWASDGPRVPVVPAPRAGVAVADRTLRFAEVDRWALLATLAGNRAASAELPAYADREPVTLTLAAATRPAAGERKAEDPVRVYLRLEVLAPGTTHALELPVFPVRAPRLEGKARGERGGPEAAT